MTKLIHTAAQYWSFFDTFNSCPANSVSAKKHALRLKTLALIAEDRHSR